MYASIHFSNYTIFHIQFCVCVRELRIAVFFSDFILVLHTFYSVIFHSFVSISLSIFLVFIQIKYKFLLKVLEAVKLTSCIQYYYEDDNNLTKKRESVRSREVNNNIHVGIRIVIKKLVEWTKERNIDRSRGRGCQREINTNLCSCSETNQPNSLSVEKIGKKNMNIWNVRE